MTAPAKLCKLVRNRIQLITESHQTRPDQIDPKGPVDEPEVNDRYPCAEVA